MAEWSVDQVLELAPDAASVSSGRDLASPSKWQSTGANGEAVWGEAKGSGTKPYQTVVARQDGASKCSCPSRKFPCKHALGLLLCLAQGEVPEGDVPVWASDWLEKRGQRETAKAERPERQTTPRSTEKRWSNVLKGLDECEAFMHDAVRGGLLAMSSVRNWDEMAAQMVDAQAPGVARRLRRIGETVGVGPEWGSKAAAELGSLSLLVQAARNIEALEEGFQNDVRAAIGIPTRKEDLPEGNGLVDVWDVVGEVIEIADQLQTSRSWLRGRGTGRWALHVAFAPTYGARLARLIPGQSFAAEARFFSSAWPLRAHLEEISYEAHVPRDSKTPVPGDFAFGSGTTWAEALAETARALAANPWTEWLPVHLRDATLGFQEDRWFAVDAEGIGFPLRWRQTEVNLLGRTGNAPSNLFGEFDGRELRLASAWGEWGVLER